MLTSPNFRSNVESAIINPFLSLSQRGVYKNQPCLTVPLKYNQIADANKKLGDTKNIRKLFIDFQKDLYLEN